MQSTQAATVSVGVSRYVSTAYLESPVIAERVPQYPTLDTLSGWQPRLTSIQSPLARELSPDEQLVFDAALRRSSTFISRGRLVR